MATWRWLTSEMLASTLLPIIQRVCLPGTIIHSDCWAAYNDIQTQTGLTHGYVNHTYNFVDPGTGIHTNHVESYWGKHKARIKNMRGVRRDQMDSYLAEMMWRDRFQGNAFNNLVTHISQQFLVWMTKNGWPECLTMGRMGGLMYKWTQASILPWSFIFIFGIINFAWSDLGS